MIPPGTPMVGGDQSIIVDVDHVEQLEDQVPDAVAAAASVSVSVVAAVAILWLLLAWFAFRLWRHHHRGCEVDSPDIDDNAM